MAASDNFDLEDGRLPVFLINGFLEAGKTEFIKFTMAQEYFRSEGTTLLLLCEEGEVEYPQEYLDKYHTVAVLIRDIRELNREYLSVLEVKHRPERILIEWNGMWNQDDLYDGPMSEKLLAAQQGREPEYEISLPASWVLYQTITIADGSTLSLHLNNGNMRAFLGQMLRNAELCIVNRCDGLSKEQLVDFRRKIRAMGQNAMLILENQEGEITQDALPEDLPYDLNACSIELRPEDYGIWFLDVMDNPERYLGKEVSFSAMVLKRKNMPKDEFIPGRMAMTCCAQDMSFLGYVCKAEPRMIEAFETRDWAKLTASIGMEERPEYHGEGPVLYLKSIARTGEIAEPVSF